MDTLTAIILGILQGLTEFLPVSSSGHLQIASALFGSDLNPEANLTFDLTLHAATVLSTIVILWHEVWRLMKGMFSLHFNEEQAYILKILVSMIPIGIVGFAFKDYIEVAFSSLPVVGTMLLATSALLAFAYYARPRQRSSISYTNAFIIGCAQSLAVLPGLSRSGTTIATGILCGCEKQSVAHFSFLMVLPPIIGNTLLDIAKGEFGGGVDAIPLAAGFASAFIAGCLACRFMIDVVKRGKLIWFAVYCAVAGTLTIVATLL